MKYSRITGGIEIGVQSGNNMRLDANTNVIALAGGSPVQATIKPIVDVLITFRSQLLPNYPLFGILKGGVAYRHMELENRISAQTGLRKLNGELQVGLAYNLSKHSTLSAYYQGIYAGPTAGVNLNSAGDITLSRIPTQQAGFIGFEYSL